MKMKLGYISIIVAITVLLNYSFANIKGDTCNKYRVLQWHDSTHTIIKSESWFCGNKRDSVFVEWDKKGRIINKGFYKQDKKDGLWETIQYANPNSIGFHSYEKYDGGCLNENRMNYVKNNAEILHDLYNYTYSNQDTVCVHRMFDLKTGFITKIDTLRNFVVDGTMKLWDEKDGFLYNEVRVKNGKIVYDKEYKRNGDIFILTFKENPKLQIESTYNCQGNLIEEKYYDEKGFLIKHKKKGKRN